MLKEKIKRYKATYCNDCGSRKVVSSHGRQIDSFRSAFSSKTGKPYYEIYLKCPRYHWMSLFSDNDVFAYLSKEEYNLALKELNL